ncbi:alpha/beta fold hydrolase [Marinobacter nanhaiticus D15-8W]|uniref:Alpha/beta fold hydrolase n=1 Tax=Marinobacter nanhaiticus D15-8W TaxID=626887 RepID=N6VVD3_9GAMM|nr:alpha/beta fold hydrolase [Marinobacter nanhaiticus D15-8W]
MPTVVLIHGAWAGSWGWAKLQPLLDSHGLRSIAIDLPGNGTTPAAPGEASLTGYVEYVVQEIEAIDDDVVLVAHSGGGVTATQVGETIPERIKGIVYIAGMMLPSGIGFGHVCRTMIDTYPEAAGIGPHLVWSDDQRSSRVPPDAARRIFLQDLPEMEARQAALKLSAQPEAGRAMVPHWTEARFGQLPRLYIEATEDRSVILEVQRQMQALVPGARKATLNTGHFPQVAAPEQLLAALLPFIRDVA